MNPLEGGLASRVATWGSLVKFSHSVFALPFALIMLMVVSRSQAVGALTVLLLIACVLAARTAAMGFNRIADREIDRRNPRTVGREIPQGRVSVGEAWGLTIFSTAVFLVCAAMVGNHCLVLAPGVLVLLFGYSLMKRLSSSCHFVLGLALACAPGGVWYALTGEWSAQPLSLMGAVLLWVAGFDILYSCQDREFDRTQGLKSIPAMLGVSGSVTVAASLHLSAVVLLVVFGVSFALGTAYWVGLAVFAILLASQYGSIFSRGIACVDQVFFTRNGLASVALCVAVAVDSVTGVVFR